MTDSDRDILICRCEEITLGEVLDAIADGVTTPDGLKRRLRTGMGLCQGRTCRRLIAQIIARETGATPRDVEPATYRPPIRPVRIAILLDEREGPPPRE